MKQLLVREPHKNSLELLNVGDSCVYFEEERVLWDSTSGKPFPEELRFELDDDTAKRVEDEERADKVIESKQYLASTDWYVIRKLETGKDIPAEVKLKREEARSTASTGE